MIASLHVTNSLQTFSRVLQVELSLETISESSVFLVSIIFCIRTRNCTKFIRENIMECFTYAQTVCTRPLLGGEVEGPGDEAI